MITVSFITALSIALSRDFTSFVNMDEVPSTSHKGGIALGTSSCLPFRAAEWGTVNVLLPAPPQLFYVVEDDELCFTAQSETPVGTD